MRTIAIAGFVALVMLSCTKEEPTKPEVKPVHYKDISNVNIRVEALSGNEARLTLIPPQGVTLAKVYLTSDTDTLATATIEKDEYAIPLFRATINHPFAPNSSYAFLIESFAINDTACRFEYNGYKHVYSSGMQYEKLMAFTQWLDFDLSPSMENLFVIDYVNNQGILKKYSISSGTSQEVWVDEKMNHSLFVRALSDNELLIKTGWFNNRYLNLDTAALVRYNISTKEQVFVSWVSRNLGVSRIINDQMVYFSPQTSASLANPTKTFNILNTKDFTVAEGTYNGSITLRDDSFDRIYNHNQVFNEANHTFQAVPFVNDNSYLYSFDNSNSRAFVLESLYGEERSLSRLNVYDGENLTYQSPYEESRSFGHSKTFQTVGSKVLFYQYFNAAKEQRADGYYVLDLGTGEVSLLQNDYNSYRKYDFALSNSTLLSLRPDGLYKLTFSLE